MNEGEAGAEGINNRTIPAMIKRSVQRYGEMPALCRKVEEVWLPISYADLDRAATCFAFGLMNLLGVRKGDHIALIADNRPEWMIASLGILYATAVDVPRGSDTPAEILQTIVRHSDARIAILENVEQLEKLRPLLGELDQLIFIDPPASIENLPIPWHRFADCLAEGERDFAQTEEQVGQRLAQLQPDDLATIIYTSGTAGNPKGVMIAHRHYMHNIEAVPGLLGNNSTDKSLAFLPIWHAFERMIEYIILSVGASVCYSNLAGLREHLVEVHPTVLATVPDFWVSVYKVFLRKATAESPLKRALVTSLLASAIRYRRAFRLLHGNKPRFRPEERPGTWSIIQARFSCFCLAPLFRLTDRLLFRRLWESLGGRLKTVSIGAGPLPAKIDEFLDAAGINVVEGYGLTEVMVIIAFRDA
ncbi:MAG: AMP-binding protein, partial [Coprothermobacterota bacterium]|nr:AMP-binding protein [Coprothermobacterota bacterium]